MATNKLNRMSNAFDELAKSLVQSLTRRAALKKFGVGLAGMALACFEPANQAKAATHTGYCSVRAVSTQKFHYKWAYDGFCLDTNGCIATASPDSPRGKAVNGGVTDAPCGCYKRNSPCSFTL
ncbi:MAG: hypothetical protein KIS67_04895 [Verrucomicrobiae bacterium]|nr:hypothetical protein [Verrucomicrobiae bacterium]